jgi:hypothetical protein
MSNLTFERDFPRHPLHYFILLSVQLVGLWGLFWFNYQPAMQLAIILSMAFSYVVWGVIHHQEHHDLHIKIVVEYILVALLAVLLFSSLILRS